MLRVSRESVAKSIGRHKTKVSKEQIKSHSKLVSKEKSLHKKYGEDWTKKMKGREKVAYEKAHSSHSKSRKKMYDSH